jgi:hypothetical protein
LNPLIIHNSAFSSSSTIIWSAAWGNGLAMHAPKEESQRN